MGSRRAPRPTGWAPAPYSGYYAVAVDNTFRMPAVPRHIVCLTFDFDTMSAFIARGLTTPMPLSRGEFGAIGARRLLGALADRRISATWFVPGFTIATYPAECEAIVAGGHEIGHHSWAHIPPAAQSRDEEEADLVRANSAIERLSGRKARGYRSPTWDLTPHTIDLLLAHGFVYDSSLMGGDFWPYRVRRGDRCALGEPYHFGAETELIEMPVDWSLDDLPHFEYLRTPRAIHPGLQPARAVMDSWLDEFLYMKKTVDWGALTYTMHPYVIGRGYRMLAFEQLIDRLMREGAVFMTMEAAAHEWAERMGGAHG